MEHPEHFSVVRKRAAATRSTTIAFVAAIHVAAIYALATGLIPHVFPKVDGDIVIIKTKPDVQPKDQGPTITLKNPSGPFVKSPVVPDPDPQNPRRNNNPGDGAQNGNGNTGPAIEPLRSIAGTHTTPPYPLMSIRLGEQGTVRLQLTVSADGRVIAATVERSSGSSLLDQAAVEWVRAHWRYQPRTVDGQAQTATTEADVRFDLRNAR